MHTGIYMHMVNKNKKLWSINKQTGLNLFFVLDLLGNSLSWRDTASSAAYLKECVMEALEGTDPTRYMDLSESCATHEEF